MVYIYYIYISFEDRLKELTDFKAKHGHTNVSCTKNNNPYKSLGHWCETLKQSYKLWIQDLPVSISLNHERIRKLLDLGFDFTINEKKSFDDRIIELQGYKKIYGHLFVPRSGRGNRSLGSWCYYVRTAYA